jgi:ABC-type microcin C transport system permease subunit YejE
MIRISKSSVNRLVFMGLVSLVLPLVVPSRALAQGTGQRRAVANQEDGPIFSEYRGVQIGMSADEARKKLGHLKDKGDTQDFFVFSDNETAQVVYDAATHKVVTLSVDFMSGAADVPLAKAVIGSDIQAKPDGSMYKMVRYAKAGYWVSYSKTAGDSPLTSVTIQKIQ